jgi:hypothetical protein
MDLNPIKLEIRAPNTKNKTIYTFLKFSKYITCITFAKSDRVVKETNIIKMENSILKITLNTFPS